MMTMMEWMIIYVLIGGVSFINGHIHDNNVSSSVTTEIPVYVHNVYTVSVLDAASYGEDEYLNVTNVTRRTEDAYRRFYRRLCFRKDGTLLDSWKVRIAFITIFSTLGLFGNTVSFIAWNSKIYRSKPYTLYLKSLAVFDNLTLIGTCVSYFDALYACYTGEKLIVMDETGCQVTAVLKKVAYLMSSWMVVCFTFDRFLAVCHPFTKRRIKTRQGALLVILGLALIAILSQSYSFVYIGTKTRTYNRTFDNDDLGMVNTNTSVSQTYYIGCSVKGRSDILYGDNNMTGQDNSSALVYGALEYFLFSFTLRFFIPFVIIACCNSCIIAEIRRKRYDPVGRVHFSTKAAKMSIYTLYLVCFVFVVTLLPHACLTMGLFVMYAQEFFNLSRRKYKELVSMLILVGTPFEMVLLVNYSFNFFLYGLSGPQFRKIVLSLLRCRTYREKANYHELDTIKKTPQSRRQTLSTNLSVL